jgi:hypothetical protein
MTPRLPAIRDRAHSRDDDIIPLGGQGWEKSVKTTLIGAATLCALASASPATAQDSATFTATTTVPAYCSQFSGGQTPMDLGALTGPTGQTVSTFASSAQTERILASGYYCNAPSTITIKADPLIQTDNTPVTQTDNFTNRVDYTATLKWDPLQNSVSSTAANATVINAAQANIGNLTLKLSDPTTDGNKRPIAGAYAGQVHLTIALQ